MPSVAVRRGETATDSQKVRDRLITNQQELMRIDTGKNGMWSSRLDGNCPSVRVIVIQFANGFQDVHAADNTHDMPIIIEDHEPVDLGIGHSSGTFNQRRG